MTTPKLSYVHGTSATPLLGETIGENLRRTVLRVPDADALVVRSQGFRATYSQLWAWTGQAARGLMALRGPAGRPGRDLVAQPGRVGDRRSTRRRASGRSSSTSTRPTAPTSCSTRCGQSGVSVLLLARRHRGSDYAAMVAEVMPGCPALRLTIVFEDGWDALLAGGSSVSRGRAGGARGGRLQSTTRSTFNTPAAPTGLPKGRRCRTTTSSTTGIYIGETLRYSERDRVCIPVPFYHCFGMVIGNLACTTHGACMVVPAKCFDPLATLEAVQAERCTSLYGVPTMFIAELEHPRFAEFDLTSLRTGVMAGSPCPIETMKQVHDADAHARGDDLLRHDRDVAGVDADAVRRRRSSSGCRPSAACIRTSRSRSSTRRRAATVPRGAPRRVVHARLQRDARLLERPRGHREAIDAGRLDAHRRPGRRWTTQGYVEIVGRIKDMIIRGGENIYPREVEEFLLHAPGRQPRRR